MNTIGYKSRHPNSNKKTLSILSQYSNSYNTGSIETDCHIMLKRCHNPNSIKSSMSSAPPTPKTTSQLVAKDHPSTSRIMHHLQHPINPHPDSQLPRCSLNVPRIWWLVGHDAKTILPIVAVLWAHQSPNITSSLRCNPPANDKSWFCLCQCT